MTSNEYTNSMMKKGLNRKNPKTSLLNVHKAIEKSQTKAGEIYSLREVKEPKVKEDKK